MNYFFDYDNFQYKINYNDKIGDYYGLPGYGVEFRRNGKSIGDAVISTKIPTFYDKNINEVSIEHNESEMYLTGIKVKSVGKGLGKIFLNMIFDEFKISKLWFYSHNHPHWEKIATNTGLFSRNGGNVYTLTKEQIPLN